MGRIILVSGGARSGKSRFAESLCMQQPAPYYYLATCPKIVGDQDLERRILLHQEQRSAQGFITVEEELDLTSPIEVAGSHNASLLLECLGTWIGNLIFKQCCVDMCDEAVLRSWVQARCEYWRQSSGTLIVVAPEAGMGMLPMERESRLWLDLVGAAKQEFAAQADEVHLLVSGLSLQFK